MNGTPDIPLGMLRDLMIYGAITMAAAIFVMSTWKRLKKK